MTTTTNTITLDRSEQHDCLYRLGERQFWRHYDGTEFYEVVRALGLQTRYIDADERPFDHSHDGNGWHRTVREYVISATPATGEDRARLVDVHDTRLALGDVDTRVMDTMGPAERMSFVAAHLASWRADRDRRVLRVQRDGQGGWEAVLREQEPVALDDDRL